MGLPEDTREKVQEWVEDEQDRIQQKEEGKRVLREVAALAEGRGYDAGDIQRYSWTNQ